jgi:hypothetical protein
MPITPTITDTKISQMFVFRNSTDTTPTGQLVICSGIANFSFFAFPPNISAGDEVSFAIPNLTVNEGQVLETTVMVALVNSGNQNLQSGAFVSWSLDGAQATQNGTQVVLDANISVKGTDSFIGKLAYHVTVLLRFPA